MRFPQRNPIPALPMLQLRVALSIGTQAHALGVGRSGWSKVRAPPLILGGCPRKNVDPMQQEDWPN